VIYLAAILVSRLRNVERCDDWWIEKNLEESSLVLIEVLLRHFPGWTDKTEKTLNENKRVPAEIQNEHLQMKVYGDTATQTWSVYIM
jgi:hypothetical protein